MKQYVQTELTRSQRCLAAARALIDIDPDSAASRAYYAAFHALSAAFAATGQTFTSHRAIRAALHRDLVREGVVDARKGRDYDFLVELRETGDYGGLDLVTEEDARMALAKAEEFAAAMELLINPDLMGETQ